MKKYELSANAMMLLPGDRGLLAIDESRTTCNERFAAVGIPQTPDARHAWRELVITCPHLGTYISGVILHDETIRQSTTDGMPFPQVLKREGIVCGIKVDAGTRDLAACPGEKVTEGLDRLRERLVEYLELGAHFAKWRAVFSIADGLPTEDCIAVNSQALARFAALCQEVGMIPVVEPEVLMDGLHTLKRCGEVTRRVLRSVFHQMDIQRVILEGLVLKTNMVLPGYGNALPAPPDVVANGTVETLLESVPAAVAGIAFLSGGQDAKLASERLNMMNVRYKGRPPWALSFSFARALQQPALEIWRGAEEQRVPAQKALLHRAWCNSAATGGKYAPQMESSQPR